MSKSHNKTSSKKAKKTRPTLAEQADRHHLYELSVQCPESEIDFVDETFRKLRGRKAHLLREDFCGTANVCCEWVTRGKQHRAIGVDLDPEVLAWGRDNQLARLKNSQAERVTLIEDNVLTTHTEPVDVALAMNFSYWLFKERQELKQYFSRVREALKADGVFFLDCFGGYDAHREIEEPREVGEGKQAFTYIWEQAEFNPIDHEVTCHIHFAFPDGSRLDKAFSYTWRLWSLPEIRDLLHEAGFSKVTVHWQGWDDDGEADGNFLPATRADADAGWICYLSAEK
jgi:cyclopropane fatty-acyl-phospholipid synthase-like methyltransferase